MQSLVGLTLGQYEIKQLLGEGGMGAVYLATQGALHREVALKVFQPADANPQVHERFIREARTAAGLEHRHIVTIYDYGTDAYTGMSYVAMRLLTGGSLDERLDNSPNQQLAISDTIEIVRQIAEGLEYAHRRGVVHRDIKPSNVMFDSHNIAYIVDFSIAKVMHEPSGLTETGIVLGTPYYMAPEYWQKETVDPATDQYALAIMVYQMLAGRLPFDFDNYYRLIHCHLFEPPIPLTQFRPDVPELAWQVISKALSKDPSQRFPSVAEFAQALTDSLRSKGDLPNRTLPQRIHLRRDGERTRLLLAIGGVVALLLVFIMLLLSNQNRNTPGSVLTPIEFHIDVRLIYDTTGLVIQNNSRETILVGGLTLTNGIDRFDGTDVPRGELPPGSCHLLRNAARNSPELTEPCGARYGLQQIPTDIQTTVFWRSSEADTFDVRINGELLTTCPTAVRGERQTCLLMWPEQQTLEED